MFLHLLLCVFLYAFLTIARAPKVWGIGQKPDGSNPFEEIQPRISANLSNQFEWPLFFYVICIQLIVTQHPISHVYVVLAWIFIIGRIIHSCVQIFTNNIRLRGMVFTINFVAVVAMWAMFLIEKL